MRYLISGIIQHSPLIKEFRLTPADGRAVPTWQPGSHIKLTFRSQSGSQFTNAYSLLGQHGDCLRIAVQREASGRGGSRVLHDEFTAGMEIDLSEPQDSFRLHVGDSRNVLIAGGIGITPLISMARALNSARKGFEMHYLVRDISRLVLMDELVCLPYGHMTAHVTESGRPDLAVLIGPYTEGSKLHACGPVSLMDAIRTKASLLGWPPDHLHFESFGARHTSEDQPLRVYLRQSGITLDVMPGTPILDAMISADAFVSYDCKRGECGNCYAAVISGQPIHRDICLTAAQRAVGMTTCVSWAAGPELELDL